MKQKNTIVPLCLGIEALVICAVALANLFAQPLYALFYNGMYGIALSTLLPLYLLHKNSEGLAEAGFFRLKARQIMVMTVFTLISVCGQLIPLLVKGDTLPFALLRTACIPLVMTTFFEEFLFRGFMQTRLEKRYGRLVALLLSGLFFSLYHVGYPGFRTAGDLLVLFAVGVFFALAFALSGNNFWVAYCVNLPNALITYLLKSAQFPNFGSGTSLYALLTVCVIVLILVCEIKKQPRKHHG